MSTPTEVGKVQPKATTVQASHVEQQGVSSEDKELTLDDVGELTLDDISSHPILERVAQRIASNVRTSSHTSHNSHYSSNS